MTPVVVGVLGPTGVGKTTIGIELARRLGTRVISCDSLQLYRGLPVLTNQPLPEELAAVPHAMVAVADPLDEWSAARYAACVKPLMEQDLARSGRALLVGGTGLYLRAAVGPLEARPEVPPALQKELETRAAKEGPEALHRELVELDPQAAACIHPRNTRRVIRALGVILAGAPEGPTRWSGRHDLWEARYWYPTVIVGLTMPRDELYRRINLRTRQMLERGAVEEVAGVLAGCDQRVGARALARGVGKAIGFRLVEAHLRGELSREELEDRLAAATRAYARRQLTWMRKVPGIVIMNVYGRAPEAVAADIAERVEMCAEKRRKAVE